MLEEVGVHLGVSEVVQRDDLDLRMPLERRLQELAADAAESIDRNTSFHLRLPRSMERVPLED